MYSGAYASTYYIAQMAASTHVYVNIIISVPTAKTLTSTMLLKCTDSTHKLQTMVM